MHSSPIKTKPKRGGAKFGDAVAEFGEIFRERELLSRLSGDLTDCSLRDKKESCSTQSGLRVGTGFREFPQTSRDRGFSLLEFYSHFKCFTNV